MKKYATGRHQHIGVEERFYISAPPSSPACSTSGLCSPGIRKCLNGRRNGVESLATEAVEEGAVSTQADLISDRGPKDLGRRTVPGGALLFSDTAKLVLARGLSTAIGFVTGPVIARLFSPTDFGLAGIVNSIGAWIGAFACLAYAQAIPLSTSRRETRALILLCLLVTSVLLVPVVLIPLVGGAIISRIMAEPALKPLLWFLPMTFLLSSFTQVAHYTCSREGRFGLLSFSGFAGGSIGRALEIGLGLLLGGSALYILSASLAAGLATLLICTPLILQVLLRSPSGTASEDAAVTRVAKRHGQFPTIQVWNSVLNQASYSLPVLIVAVCFGLRVVGYYSMGLNVIMLPMTILAGSLAQVFYPQAARDWSQKGEVSGAIHTTIRIISLTCVFPLAIVGLLGPLLFSVFFGSRWHEAGIFSQILAPWVLARLVASPISTMFLVRRRAGMLMTFNAVWLVGGSGALLLAGRVAGPRVGLMCFSAVGLLAYVWLAAMALRLGGAPWRPVTAELLQESLYSFGLLLPASIAYWAGGPVVLCIALALAGTVAYAARAYRRGIAIRHELRDMVRATVGARP